MKITLIRPNIGKVQVGINFDDGGRMQPLALAVIASLTPADIDVVMYDDRIVEIPFDEATDLVAINVEIYTARRSYEIANEFRKRGIKVILGGIHPSLMPEEASEHADSVFVGDAEFLWDEVVFDLRENNLQPFYHSKPGRRTLH